MNKVININLAGRLIVIDEHAYHTLYGYLEKLKKYFGKEQGGNEIIHDMEDRIGELFQDKIKKGKSCIMEDDVQEIISIMGLPEQIENETTEGEPHFNNRTNDNAQQQQFYEQENKQLHRNTHDKTIAGVCSGIADYFNIDVLVVRLLFVLVFIAWGTGLLIYIILWLVLPVNNTPRATRFKKKIYRNTQSKVVGGVCSGMSAYFNTDVIVLRLLFVLPLLFTIFFSAINSNMWIVSLAGAGIPTSILLYIVLWIIIPKATTIAEQLEMTGEPVDVQSLSMAMKQRAETITSSSKSSLRNLIGVLFKIFLFIVLATVIITLIGLIIGVFVSIFALKTTSVSLLDIGSIIAPSPVDNYLFWISLALVMFIPFIACIRLILRLITGKKRNKWVGNTLTFGFIAAVFCLFWVSTEVVAEFSNKKTISQNLIFNPPNNDTLIIKNSGIEYDGKIIYVGNQLQIKSINVDDTTLALMNVKIDIKESEDNQYHFYVKKAAYGRNVKVAEDRADAILPDYKQEGNIFYISDNILQSNNIPFRGERLQYVLEIPKGITFKVQGFKRPMNNVYIYGSSNDWYWRRNKGVVQNKWKENTYYTMGVEQTL